MKTYIFFMQFLLLSCVNKQISESTCSEIKKISISDKFTEPYNQKYVITDSTIMANFCRELKHMQSIVKQPVVKVNFGFYILDLFYKDGREVRVEIIYTKYDGVIIRYDGKYYKNNELDSVMRGYLAPEQWRD